VQKVRPHQNGLPFNVKTPPILYGEERNHTQIDEPCNDRPTTSTLTSSTLLLQVRHEEQPEITPHYATHQQINWTSRRPTWKTTKSSHQHIKHTKRTTKLCHRHRRKLMTTPKHRFLTPMTKDKDLRKKREHSPEQHDEPTKKPTIRNEVIECKCGCPLILSNQPGPFTDCTCRFYYVKCICKNVIATKGDNAVNCVKCGKTIPWLNLDTTM